MIKTINIKIENSKQNDTSFFQNKLPVSSDYLSYQLKQWNIEYKWYNHIPLKTVKELKLHQSQFLSYNQCGGHIKNLYLRDCKKKNIPFIAEQDALINLKKIDVEMGDGRLSFG